MGRRNPIECLMIAGIAILAGHQPAFAENPLPKVIMEDGTPVVELPGKLTQFISVKFPDLRLPGKADMKGGWATFHGKREIPYACWGDFNGDGLTDVALIL